MEERNNKNTVAIITGKGELPIHLAAECKKQNKKFIMIGVEGNTPSEIIENNNGFFINLMALGKAFKKMHECNVGQIVMAGRIERPSLKGVIPDATSTKLIARLGSKLLAGDNRLLSIITKFIEENGFEVVGAEDIAPELLVQEGVLGKIKPNKNHMEDIEIGFEIAKKIGQMDIGQAVIIDSGNVLGVEAMEGTDKLISRCANLKISKKGAVLIKVKKPGQERRVDLPTIGVKTVINVAKAGFAGIAAEAGSALIIDREEVRKEADNSGIFVTGIKSP